MSCGTGVPCTNKLGVLQVRRQRSPRTVCMLSLLDLNAL